MGRAVRILALGMVLGIPGAGVPQAGSADPFARVRFLAGEWRGEQSGQPGRGVSHRQYEFVLGGRFLQVKNQSSYPPQAANPKGEVHQDLGLIGYDRAREKLVFRQFHQEGFVNTYVEQAGGEAGAIVFTSEAIENISAGWRARETYRVASQDEFIERFELAAPGKDFELYSEARLKRVR